MQSPQGLWRQRTWKVLVKYPFTERRAGRFYIREFAADASSDELIWHRDREDRKIKVVESTGWMLQLDNELPVELREGDVHNISAYQFHRVIKGSGPLKIIVEKKVRSLESLLEEIKKGDTVSYDKKGKKVRGKVVVPDARGPLVGVDPEGPDKMDMVPEDELSEADRHPPTYKPGKKSIRGMTRGKALEKSKEDLEKAKELRKKGQAGKAKELEQRAYRRRESMEKAERDKPGYKHKKSQYSEAHLNGLLDEIITEKKYSASVEKSLKNKAKKHNAPLGALRAVYSKGLGAYSSSGSRPGQTPQAWAMARVNSFLKGGKARDVDAAQWKQVQKHRKKKRT